MSSWKLWIDDHKLVCALLALILLAALLCGYFFYGRPALLRSKYKLAYEAEILGSIWPSSPPKASLPAGKTACSGARTGGS